MASNELPTIKTDDGRTMFLDLRLVQLRNTTSPSDFLQFGSVGEMDDWLEQHMVEE